MRQIQELLETSRRAGAAIAFLDRDQGVRLGALRRARLTGEALDRRLLDLAENALTARTLARSYLCIARQFLDAARRSRGLAQDQAVEAHLREAHQAHEQARKCLSFARICERRADGLGGSGDWR